MDDLLPFLEANWFALALIAAALVTGGVALRRRRAGSWWSWAVAAGTMAALGAGGLALAESPGLALWLAVGVAALLLLLLAVILVSGHWSALVGYVCAALLLAGLGGLLAPIMNPGLTEFGRFLLSLTPLDPWWLLL